MAGLRDSRSSAASPAGGDRVAQAHAGSRLSTSPQTKSCRRALRLMTQRCPGRAKGPQPPLSAARAGPRHGSPGLSATRSTQVLVAPPITLFGDLAGLRMERGQIDRRLRGRPPSAAKTSRNMARYCSRHRRTWFECRSKISARWARVVTRCSTPSALLASNVVGDSEPGGWSRGNR